MLAPLIQVHSFWAAGADVTPAEQPGCVGLEGLSGETEPPQPVNSRRVMPESAVKYDLSPFLIPSGL
jgi:hypothetical protein